MIWKRINEIQKDPITVAVGKIVARRDVDTVLKLSEWRKATLSERRVSFHFKVLAVQQRECSSLSSNMKLDLTNGILYNTEFNHT